jgi:hypothetical protein
LLSSASAALMMNLQLTGSQPTSRVSLGSRPSFGMLQRCGSAKVGGCRPAGNYEAARLLHQRATLDTVAFHNKRAPDSGDDRICVRSQHGMH